MYKIGQLVIHIIKKISQIMRAEGQRRMLRNSKTRAKLECEPIKVSRYFIWKLRK